MSLQAMVTTSAPDASDSLNCLYYPYYFVLFIIYLHLSKGVDSPTILQGGAVHSDGQTDLAQPQASYLPATTTT